MIKPQEVLKRAPIFLHTETCQAFVGRRRINLTTTEFNLLACFLRNGGTTLSRAMLLTTAWDESYRGTSRTVDTHIQRLRRKLGRAGYFIRTVRGVGYRLEVPPGK